MCGICGIVCIDRDELIAESTLHAMRDMMSYRGPDSAGAYLRPGVALGARRLRIIDLSDAGQMPMSTPDGRCWITYNGAVYNYRELRARLERLGYVFRSNTDTEVVLNMYAEFGPEMLPALNGMFAFGIWDSHARTLFLGRDHLGIKPLYYAETNGALYFASEPKALFAAGVPATFNHDTWEELLCFRYVAGAQTPYVGVNRLLPGHYLLWQDGTSRIRRWWQLADRAQELRAQPVADPTQWFGESFKCAVEQRRISDVPVGLLLSGGLDSSSLAATFSASACAGVPSFTVRFDEQRYDEGGLAQLIAAQYNLAYHELTVSPAELLTRLEHASWLNGEPLAHGSDLHLLAIAQYAKRRVTVLLSGEGADETLGGYVRYRPLQYPQLLNTARSFLPALGSLFNLNGRVRKLNRFLRLNSLAQFVLFNACDVLPGDLPALGLTPKVHYPFREEVLRAAQALYPNDYVHQAMYSDQHTFLCSILDRNDRMTMGASIECRVPFLDRQLVEGLVALPSSVLLAGGRGKYLLRASIGKQLPPAVQRHRKWGFGVPWKYYLRQVPELRALIHTLPEAEPISSGPFERAKVKKTVQAFEAGDGRYQELLLQLLMIVVWYRSCFKTSRLSAAA